VSETYEKQRHIKRVSEWKAPFAAEVDRIPEIIRHRGICGCGQVIYEYLYRWEPFLKKYIIDGPDGHAAAELVANHGVDCPMTNDFEL